MEKQSKRWVIAATVGLSLGACAPESDFFGDAGSSIICRPCGSIATGELTASGSPRLDGFVEATYALRANVSRAQAEFDAGVLEIAKAFGMETDGVDVNAPFLQILNNTIEAEIAAHTTDGLAIRYNRPRCEASAGVAAHAQATCEKFAKCKNAVTPGEVALTCDGICTGQCSGTCTGELACAVEAAFAGCEGLCEGVCNLDVAGTCDGTCDGECDEDCSLTDPEGKCMGSCSGLCTGTCELHAASSCGGTCTGTCLVDPGSAACTAEASCRGGCEGECTGSCVGSFDPPSAMVDCEATAECQGQARAQAQASITCTPSLFELAYELKGGLTAEQKSTFLYRLDALKTHGPTVLQAGTQLVVLFTGEVGGEVVFEPAPIFGLFAAIESVVDTGVSGDEDVPAGRWLCVVPAFLDAMVLLDEIRTRVETIVLAQAKLVIIFGE